MRSKTTPKSRRRKAAPAAWSLPAMLAETIRRIGRLVFARLQKSKAERQLRLCETVSLGDKRFVAVIEVGPQRFLIGGTTHSVSLLGKLRRPSPPEFAGLLTSCETHRVM
jgi:flagellar biogenesis protein FliO